MSPLKKEINIDILTKTFGKSYANSNSKMAKEHKYKDKDEYKDEDKKLRRNDTCDNEMILAKV